MCMHVCLSVKVQRPAEARESIRSPGVGAIGDCELLDLGSLGERQTLLTVESLLQP